MPLLIHSLTWRPSSKSHIIIISLHKMLSPPGLELRRTEYVVIYFTPECLTSVTVVPAVVWLLKTRLVVCHCKNRACPREYFPRNCGSSTRYPGSISLLQQKIIYWANKDKESSPALGPACPTYLTYQQSPWIIKKTSHQLISLQGFGVFSHIFTLKYVYLQLRNWYGEKTICIVDPCEDDVIHPRD